MLVIFLFTSIENLDIYKTSMSSITTTNKEDDILIDIARKLNIKSFRGDEKDKLKRWYDACKEYNIKNIVTVDGDDLFAETSLIDQAFKELKKYDVDFIKGDHTKLICGSFTYAFTFNSLKRVIELKGENETEMMWVYFTETNIFKIKELDVISDKFYKNDIRMTLDYKEDLDFFNAILVEYKNLSNLDSCSINLFDIIKILDKNPEIKNINYFRQNAWKTNQENNTRLVLKNRKKFIGNEMKYVSEIINNAKRSSRSKFW